MSDSGWRSATLADIRVEPPSGGPYFVEIKYGHPTAGLSGFCARHDSAAAALACARAFVDIGASVALDWQRQIDHVQRAGGAHVGVALGDLNIVSLRPFSRTHISAIADSVNTAASEFSRRH